MFEHFSFSKTQLEKYYQSAKRDFQIANTADVPEVSFHFCYNALVKLAITICAIKGLRVKSKKGHHIELIKRMSLYLNDPEIEILASEMRAKRNWDLYGGGTLISIKEAKSYLNWAREIFQKAEKQIENKQPKLKLFQ
ncbi:hypothetical protein COT40_01785 [Candidatus Peregrinibacteria bacterium CG08_land_8_20_14_0_20_41_10]|nr:MAG: hypothetical protein COT40_01785 [Candidatus Peregrinibacteria bacterium CG08_land_8_20_14_0_20_41_10]